MTPLHVYCVTDAANAPGPALAGIGAGGVEAVVSNDIAAWVEEVPVRPVATLESLRAHHRVVQAAAAAGPALPARFGTSAEDAEALRESLQEAAAAYRAGLERVRDAVEYGVRIAGGAGTEGAPAAEAARGGDAAAGAGPGRAHLERLRARHRERERRLRDARRLAGELREELGSRLREERVDVDPRTGGTIAHLVAVPDADAWLAAVDKVRRRRPELELVVTGPWPPYSFTPERGGEGQNDD